MGILRAFSNAGIRPSVIAGTSMGAIIAAGYVQQMDFQKMEMKFREFVLKYAEKFAGMDVMEAKGREARGIFGDVIHALSHQLQMAAFAQKRTLKEGDLLREIAEHFVHPCDLEKLSMPVYLCTLDMVGGQGVFLHKGSAQPAVQAALSIAGYFPGVALGERELYDAQGVYPVPVQAFRHAEVDAIVACSVDRTSPGGFHAENVVDLLFRQNELAYRHILCEAANCSDVLIRPALDGFHWTDFRKMDAIIRAGLAAGEKAVPAVQDIIRGKIRIKPLAERPWHDLKEENGPRIVFTGFPSIKK
jgi:NTE family protein